MLSLSDRLTVPQIFFNEQHIGGAEDTLKVLKEWDKNGTLSYDTQVSQYDDPTDPRLQPSTDPPVVEKPPPKREPFIVRIPQKAGKKNKGRRGVDDTDEDTSSSSSSSSSKQKKDEKFMTVLNMTELLKRTLPRRDLKYWTTLYKMSFTGKELIDVLVHEFDLSRSDAVTYGQYLQKEHRLIHHVVNGSPKLVDDRKDLFFRLQSDQTPNVLNSYRIWTERVDEDSMGLLKRLKKQLSKILDENTDSNGKVDYISASKHKDFPAFEEASCEIQGVNMETMSSDMKLAFSINLYNLAIKYAFTKLGIGTDSTSRSAFFSNVAIQVGGSNGKIFTLSFQDLENGVLRGNRKAPYTFSKPFGPNDERNKLVMQHVDNRLHFALNCGASSCPPVKNFTADGIQEELRIVAQAFCEDDSNVRYDLKTNTLYLNKILYWYGVDFGSSSEEIAKTVATFLRKKDQETLKKAIAVSTIKVQYNFYDWGTDARDGCFVPFQLSSIKTNVTKIL